MNSSNPEDQDIFTPSLFSFQISGWKYLGWQIPDWKVHGCNVHGSKVHGWKVHGRKVHGCNVHGSKVHGWKVHGWKVQGWKVQGWNVLQPIKSDVPIKEEPDGNIEDIPNEIVDIYYDQLEDWYETEEEPKPKKARRGRPSKNCSLVSEQNSDEEWKDVKNVKRKIKGRPKKSE